MPKTKSIKNPVVMDSRFALDSRFEDDGPSESLSASSLSHSGNKTDQIEAEENNTSEYFSDEERDDLEDGMDPEELSKSSSSKIIKTLTPEALEAKRAAQEHAGVVFISRIPPGMRPTKVRHFMSQYGEVGRVYLQQEDPKRAYLRKKYTATKKAHFTEGWVEFKDKRVARSVATMLNAQPIGGKKGTRWRDDIWTMKYLPKFKWNMLTEQIAHEAAIHTARLRVELEQSRREQKDYLRQVELARVLNKRAERKRKAAEERGETIDEKSLLPPLKKAKPSGESKKAKLREAGVEKKLDGQGNSKELKTVLSSIF